MRVMVTGAAGFIGSHLSEALLSAGHEVVGLDCFTDHYPRRFKEANLELARRSSTFEFHELDLRTDQLDHVVEGVDVVVNEAAAPGLIRSWNDFEEYVSCNLEGVHHLIESCRRHGVTRFVQASTSSVYGQNAVGDEHQPTRPVSPYGVTKLAAENLLLAHHAAHQFPVVILRYFSVYGPRQRPDMAYRRFADQLLRGEGISVFGDGMQSRGNTYVRDCVDATMRAMEHGEDGLVCNIGGGAEISLLRAIDLLAAALDVTPNISFHPPRPGDQIRTIADVGLARDALGWEPTTTPEVGLVELAEWARDARIQA